MYFLHCGYLIFNWAVIPVLTFLVATEDNFRCSDNLEQILMVLRVWYRMAFPICFQAVFTAIVTQLYKIESNSPKTQEMNRASDSHFDTSVIDQNKEILTAI